MNNSTKKENIVLISEFVRLDFKLRYQSSFLGYLWALLRPMFLFLILYVVFTQFFSVGRQVENYPVYLIIGTAMWNMFSEITNSSINAIVGKAALMRKIRFPKQPVLAAITISALINLIISFLVVYIIVLIQGVPPAFTQLFAIIPILQLAVFATGVGFFLSTLYVRLRDLNNLWPVVLQAGFYMTPILYPVSFAENTLLQKILMASPIAQAINDARFFIMGEDFGTTAHVYGAWIGYIIPLSITGLVVLGGYKYFSRNQALFAETA